MNLPTKEGFYWGQWLKPSPSTADRDEDVWPQPEWEVHHVVVNNMDPKAPEHLMVMVPGVQAWQSIESFMWGPHVAKPAGLPRLKE